jgi:hypothetical protein
MTSTGLLATAPWTCGYCNETHTELQLDIALRVPDPALAIPEEDRCPPRVVLKEDFAIVDRQAFLRCVIEIPIVGIDDTFNWGVWIALADRDMDSIMDSWSRRDIEIYPCYAGRLGNDIDRRFYPPTRDLPVQVRPRSTIRPSAIVESIDHPLAIEQRDGIALDRVRAITHR